VLKIAKTKNLLLISR